MAIRQYIGARYVPRFTGLYDVTQIYEALDVVDNGAGTSYIARKPVPAGIPLTNTDYWFIYGASSGAILDLQDRMDAVELGLDKVPTNRKMIVIGDSFGYGIRGGGQPWVTGWITHLHNIMPGQIFSYETTDVGFEGTAAFLGVNPWYDLFDWIITNKITGVINPEEITDVVVLGGSNEPSDSAAALETYIANTFIPHVKTVCPNARIAIGCLGLDARMLYGKAYQGYKQGALKGGAEFIEDLLNLGTIPSYDSGYGHWSESGYNLYNPYIAHAALFGHVNFKWGIVESLTPTSEIAYDGTPTFSMIMIISNKGIKTRVFSTIGYSGWMLQYRNAWSVGTAAAKMFTIANKVYAYFDPGAAVASSLAFDNQTGGRLGAGNMQILGDNTDGWYINFSSFIQKAPTASNPLNIFITWDGAIYADLSTTFDA